MSLSNDGGEAVGIEGLLRYLLLLLHMMMMMMIMIMIYPSCLNICFLLILYVESHLGAYI